MAESTFVASSIEVHSGRSVYDFANHRVTFLPARRVVLCKLDRLGLMATDNTCEPSAFNSGVWYRPEVTVPVTFSVPDR